MTKRRCARCAASGRYDFESSRRRRGENGIVPAGDALNIQVDGKCARRYDPEAVTKALNDLTGNVTTHIQQGPKLISDVLIPRDARETMRNIDDLLARARWPPVCCAWPRSLP
jgi:hypothetical protein